MVEPNRDTTGFLADTWWFGLSQRLSDKQFEDLAALRTAQGFSAIQLVVGVPPEVGPENRNAKSQAGFPWTLDGCFNQAYLTLARKRVQHLNDLGLLVIVYGAWGHQIDWLGLGGMTNWWIAIIETLDDLSVIYCLCGESSLWLGEAAQLLPDKSTDDLFAHRMPMLKDFWTKVKRRLKRRLWKRQFEQRRRGWSSILDSVSSKTNRPVIIHPVPDDTGYESVLNPELLSANTVQTGHHPKSRNRLWELPLALLKTDTTQRGYINLEPWYEGIGDQFWADDQMFAYWVTMCAGAASYCYGAQGIWNAGDGDFLAHWGRQTLAQAMALDTPRLLGLSHKQYLLWNDCDSETFYQTERGELITIGRKIGRKTIQYFPNIARAKHFSSGKVWLPLQGVFTESLPREGQVVIFRDG